MISKFKFPLLLAFGALSSWWIGTGIFNYFTHTTPPFVSLKGIATGGSYARDVLCTVVGNNDYKISDVTVIVDSKPLITSRVKSCYFELPFTIDTTTLIEGAHTLTIEATDSSYNRNKIVSTYTFNIDNTPLRASFIDPEYSVFQGKTLHIKINANKPLAQAEIKFLSTTYHFYPESDDSTLYECFIPIDCEERSNEYMINVDIEDLVKNKIKLTSKVHIKPFEFKKQKGFSVNEDKLSQEKEISISEKVLNTALEKWLEQSPKKKLWSGRFEYPIEVSRISTPFGEIRTTPQRGRYMHKGVDLINHPKCVVWAAQDGNVIIKDRFFLTGNTVVIDHGLGIFTLYAHLEDFADIEVGALIKKGCPVGKLGMTGYASGYHLHWELRINNVSVDPLEWTTKVF